MKIFMILCESTE